MTVKLSHSGHQKFMHCSQLYKNHYIDRIRPIRTTSALGFGSAIDVASEDYLLNRNKEQAAALFIAKWKEQENNEDVDYFASDLDTELYTQSDHELLLKDTSYTSVSDLLEAGERLNYANWLSLARKGEIIVAALINWVDENVEEVLETQATVELIDDNEDEITGKPDVVFKLKGSDIPLLTDIKTAARPYQRDSVKTSEQLAVYFHYLKNTKYPDMKEAAYLVFNKNIKKNRKKTCQKCGEVTYGREQLCAAGGKGKKRCNGEFTVEIFPEASVQFIRDEIPQFFIDQVLGKFSIAIATIKTGCFEKNLEGCSNYFGKQCPYFKYCHEGDLEGLIVKEDK